MSSPLEVLARHGVEIALALTLLLAVGALAVRCHESPVSRHRFTEWTLGLAILAALLLVLPLPRWRSSDGPRVEAPATSERWEPASFELERTFAARLVPGPPDSASTNAEAPVRPMMASEVSLEAAPLPETATSLTTARWLSLGFLLGAAGFALHLAVSLWWLRRLLRRARPAPAWVLELTPRQARTRVLVSTETERPFCSGFGPRGGTIVLPASLVARHQRRRLRVVLLHERAHLEQRHGRTRLIAALAAPFFYWQPLYWWLVRASRRDAELVADDLASGSMDKRDYAAELLGLVESTDRASLVAATGPGALGSRRNFHERMETLLMRRTPLTFRESRLQLAGRTTLALLLLASVTLAFGHTPQQGEPDEKSPAPLPGGIPTLADRVQDGEDPTDQEAVPLLSELPTIGFLFQSAGDGTEDGSSDAALVTVTVELPFQDLNNLWTLEDRCREEGGRVVSLTLHRSATDQQVTGGYCRVVGLTAEARQRISRALYRHVHGGAYGRLLLYPEFDNKASTPVLTPDQPTSADPASAEIAAMEREIDRLERRLAQLEQEKLDVELALASKRLELDQLRGWSTVVTEPPIQGLVLEVSGAPDSRLVAINRGSAHGVEVGTTFEIYREANYKGRVEVIRVQAHMCIGKVVARAQPMTQGDRATTRL